MADFLITSELSSALPRLDLEHLMTGKSFQIWGSKGNFKSISGLGIFILGYVMPRYSYHNTWCGYFKHELVARLFLQYGEKFVKFLKGNFIILIARHNEVFLYNDIHSIEKFFILDSPKGIIISNNVLLINALHQLELNHSYPAIQALFQHPIKGMTIFRNLKYSEYASFIRVGKELKIERYWNPITMIHSDKNLIDQTALIDLFRNIVKSYIEYFKTSKIAMTLTGGRDTRSVLSALLNLGQSPHCFTYGFPEGTDVVTARNICQKLNLPFSNHKITDLNKNSYSTLVNEIVSFGNPLINLHRAHRLGAIKTEEHEQGSAEMLFVGAMGGDYIKGISFNDYIITEFMRMYFYDNETIETLVKKVLSGNFVRHTDELLQSLVDFIGDIEYMDKSDFKRSEFLLAHSFVGSMHDSQDLFLFSKYSKYVVAPFMDIDFMEALFQSPYSLLNNYRTSSNPFKKIRGGEFQAQLIKSLYEPLAHIPMANKYKPVDLLGNRYIYMFKRLIIELSKEKTRPTFSYGNWFTEYVGDNIKNLREYLSDSYYLPELIRFFNDNEHKTVEGYWHRFSNPVLFYLWFNEINKNHACCNIKE